MKNSDVMKTPPLRCLDALKGDKDIYPRIFLSSLLPTLLKSILCSRTQKEYSLPLMPIELPCKNCILAEENLQAKKSWTRNRLNTLLITRNIPLGWNLMPREKVKYVITKQK